MSNDNYIPQEELSYIKQDEAFIEDLFKSLLEKREKYCTHCYYNKNGVCRNSCRMPVKNINYCSKWFKEDI